jgi:glycosyltransferase involved in cell wall biosynthesis
MRYAWSLYFDYLANPQFGGRLTRMLMPWMIHPLRVWDVASSSRVDIFLANSNNVQKRINKFYRRDATVIYPPVRVAEKKVNTGVREDFFLVVSRLIPQKNIELVVDSFNENGLPLKIIGQGSLKKQLQAKAKKNIEFLGFLCDEEVDEYFARCKALIFPCEDDFGMTPVEAMAHGTPVIALGKGGALETVIHGKTGILFDTPTIESLTTAINAFNPTLFSPTTIREHAMQFDEAKFKIAIKKLLTQF